MKDSNVRVSYITEYITSYEAKIKALNKDGLFDSARLFELFAIEICKLWFKQDFYNLNNENINYPYVDLVSKDKTIFVQVSTQQNLANKIKTTLKNINENKSEKIAKIKSVYFFVLNNDSVDKVVDYSGDEKIGNIEFKKSEHLITTQDVVKKAASDLEFQKALYELLQKEDSKIVEISNKLLKEIKNSKEIGLKSIDCLINDEYEIDRTEIIEKIKNADNRFISVRGEAGSGKSVICKKVIENEEYLLFARAERFVEESNINDIWHFNIQDAFEYLCGKTLTIFIDSLEFIADAPKTKLDTLQSLYELAKDYKNVKIITSCRSCDENAFIKIDSKYYIETFLVDNLSAIELSKISRKYPIINAFVNDFKYVDLVRSPFYVNLIVKNITDASNISDENKLRDFIWENVICLREKSKQYGVLFNDVVKEVKKVVFNRSKLFLLGINKDILNQKVLHALLSEGVTIDNGNIVRLKYDIFEDICFEKEIDNIFSECRGDYNSLFCKIEEFGRCCYRRYQIWISNKLFTKTNRDKFLYELISTDNLQPKWFTQTIIGIVKSRFSTQFFEEQTNNIITQDLLQKFVDITNLYAFDAKVLFLKNGQRMILQPKGYGRIGLIKIIYKNKLYETDAINVNSVIKLCSDYASGSNLYDEVSSMACLILESYINKELENNNKVYNVYKKINTLLEPIYLMSNSAYEWINSFWDTQLSNFLGSEHDSRRLAEEIIEHTLKLTPNSLAKTHTKELFNLAETFWTAELENSHLFYGSRYNGVSYSYGLNKQADSYEHSRDTLTTYNLFNNLLEQSFRVTLNWMINFINKATLSCLERKEVDLQEITIQFVTNNKEKKYYANQHMWLSGSQECHFPALLGDMVYTLKKHIINAINTAIKFNINYKEFASKIKEVILQNSNNIILFSIIEDVGIHFEKEIPGLALDLATSIEIINWDINRYTSLNPTSEVKMLRNNIFAVVGMPYIKDKYEDGSEMKCMLQDYVVHMQFVDETREYCYKVLDYLYAVYPNDEENAHEHLQIQKMDFRNASIEIVDEQTVALSPTITGAAQKVVDENVINNTARTNVENTINDFLKNFNPEDYNLNDVIKYIDNFQSEISKVEATFGYNKDFVTMICFALNKEDLTSDKRNEFCDFWINGVESILDNSSFSFDYAFLFVLFRQINSNASVEIKNRIKRLILNITTYKGDNGLASKLKDVTREFLKTNSSISNAVFNTIIMLAEDEMKHQEFNYNYIIETGEKCDIEFVPNHTPRLKGVDRVISQEGKTGYNNKTEEIVSKYLYCEEALNIFNLSIDKLDINILHYVVYCGLTISEPAVSSIIKEIIKVLFDDWTKYKNDNRRETSIDFSVSYEIADFLGTQLFENYNAVLDILFTNIDFTKCNKDVTDFYINVFGCLLPKYFDAYNDFNGRKQCETVIFALEEKLSSIICNSKTRAELYRALILSVSGYEGDWSKVKTGYSYADIQFLNKIFGKYGKYNFKFFMSTLYKMKFEELLPNILPSVATTLEEFSKEEYFDSSELSDTKKVLEYFIVLAFLDFNDEIKQDEELTQAYEKILELLIGFNFERAAVLLDEFRIF